MRVTKLIREYIEEKVNEAYPKPEATLCWEEKSNRVNEAMTEAEEKITALKQQIVEEINEKYGFSKDGYRLRPAEYREVLTTSYWDEKLYEESKKADKERAIKVEASIKEILVSLELGGTKADLDKMLAEVGKGA